MSYKAHSGRYDEMSYRRCGRSGLLLPAVSLGLWHNFGSNDDFENARSVLHAAFDLGITHFDLANNYGPPAGSAEKTFGKIFKQDLKKYRDEIIVSTKAGYYMWPGPYGDWGSLKYITASLDQSLQRMGLDYVDIFYHHRHDPETPIEESMYALHRAVQQGKALYVGISKYNVEQCSKAFKILKELGTPCIIHQPAYNMFNRQIESDLLPFLEEEGIGCITFSPLAQGLLSDKYIKGIPKGSRASKKDSFLKPEHITDEKLAKAIKLNEIAEARGETLPQMALAWNLRNKGVTSVLTGASSVKQIKQNAASVKHLHFSDEELKRINEILG